MVLYPQGTWVFVPDADDEFAPARVIESFESGKPGKVDREGHRVKISAADSKRVQPMDEQSLRPIANMVELKELNEAAILHNLRLRFSKDEIYTNVGSILVSVNPFKLLPLYTPDVLELYKQKGYRGNEPHVYGVADDAYRNLVQNQQNQSCIVSGESGAGKTEATKIFLQYIAEISGTTAEAEKKGKKKGASSFEEASLQEQILKANPLMEAFGNAKTSRNNNSSRFGKWIEVQFNNRKGTVVGGQIIQYLLEKSRIVHQAKGERNYHIFYDLCAGASMDKVVRDKFRITEADDYRYLSQSGVTTVEGINDERDWEDVIGAMEVIGISNDQQDEVLRTIAAILHLGNIEFVASGGEKFEEGSKVENKDVLELTAAQFGVSAQQLEEALTKKKIKSGREVISKVNNVVAAGDARDVLAKEVYSKMFDWLINRINQALQAKSKQVGGHQKGTDSIIGVLDIFGFESFEYNSFEQLCINYCNEKLQFHFNEHIFKLEQQEYQKEGVDVSNIEFVDNMPCLQLLEAAHGGVFSMIDEEMNIPKGNDEQFLRKASKKHENHKNFRKPGVKSDYERQSFTIVHYAGEVMYNVTGFLEKNKDKLSGDLESLVNGSKYKFVASLFHMESKQERGRPSKGNRQSIAAKFKNQLANLMKTLYSTEPHFIRCVKPNDEKRGSLFSSDMVLDQLRYAGLLEVCRIRQIGYPVRRSFNEFFRRFLPLVPKSKDVKSLCKNLEAKKLLPKGEYQIGTSKVFIRAGPYSDLEMQREDALREQAVMIQAVARGFVARRRVHRFTKILKKLRKGMKNRDYDTLKQAIEDAADLPNQNMEILTKAYDVLKVLEKEKRTTDLVQTAIEQRDLAALQSALSAAHDANITNPTVTAAEEMVAQLKQEKKVLDKLNAAVEARDLEALEDLMKKATKLNLHDKNEVKAGATLQQRLKDEAKAIKAMSSAISSKNLEKIKEALARATELGMENEETMRKGAKLRESILAQASAAEQEAAREEAERVQRIREKTINETKKLLVEAAKSKDLDKLAVARAKVIELGMGGKEVDELIAEAVALESMKDNIADLVAACTTLKSKAQNKDGLEESDVVPLTKCIKTARKKGVGENIPQMAAAIELERKSKEQLKVQVDLIKAIQSDSLKQLRRALDMAGDLDMEIDTVHKVRQLVKEKEAARPKEERTERKEVDMDEDEFERQRKANMAMASHERYNFRKYYKIRTDSDYVKSVFFNKKRVAEAKLMYQKTFIPKSILELDKDLNKMAVGVHKSLLGYCGEQQLSFPATLAQDILIKGLEQPELVDEIYIQLCKHLTSNPKPESVGRAWQVMCMAVGTFPPSSDFEYYLLNFLIDHLQVPGLVGNYARYSLRRLEGMLIRGASGFVPNIDEILAYKERPPILATIELVDGTPLTEDLPITPDLNVEKVLEICTHFLSLQDERVNTFGIFVQDTEDEDDTPQASSSYAAKRAAPPPAGEPPVAPDDLPPPPPTPSPPPRTPRPLRGKDYMGDVVVQMTRQRRTITFVFKRKIFLKKQDFRSEDPVYSRLMYLQAADEVISGNIPIKKEEMVIELTALALAADSESFPNSEQSLLEADLMEYIPVPWRPKHKEVEWAKMTLSLRGKVASKTLDELQWKYVDKVRKLPLWGMCFFFVRKEADGDDLICAINYEGVYFLSLQRNQMQSFKYADVHRWGGSSTQFWLLVWDEKKQRKVKMALFTSQARDMSALILDYALLASERK